MNRYPIGTGSSPYRYFGGGPKVCFLVVMHGSHCLTLHQAGLCTSTTASMSFPASKNKPQSRFICFSKCKKKDFQGKKKFICPALVCIVQGSSFDCFRPLCLPPRTGTTRSSSQPGSEFQADGKKIPSLVPCAKALVVRRPRHSSQGFHLPVLRRGQGSGIFSFGEAEASS